MFNSNVLDVAIGMIFVYLLLSLMCSAANEIIELWLKNRAADLERGLRELLKDDTGTGLVKSLYSHHLVNGLFKGEYNQALYRGWLGWVKRLLGQGQLPSYIPARNFALALMDLVPRVGAQTKPAESAAQVEPKSGAAFATASTPTATPGQVVVNVAGNSAPEVKVPPPAASATTAEQIDAIKALRGAIQNLRSTEVKETLTALVDAAGNDLTQVRQNLEDWFNSSMDRVSGWYKRRSQIIVLVIGLIVAIAVNADSLAITKRLWTDRALRESLVSAADAYAKANAAISPTPTPTPPPAPPASRPAPTPKASPSPTPAASPATTASPTPAASPTPLPCWFEECKANKDSPQCKLKKANCEIEGLGLPIGWTPPEDKWPGLHFWTSEFWTNWAIQFRLHGFGWLLTAFAVSLGAPFWFDMLNKFIVVRSTVKPKEKSPDEPSKS